MKKDFDINLFIASLKLRTPECPIYSAELEAHFEITGSEVRDIIRSLRRDGHPIANSSKGYFYARTYTEIEPTILDLKSRSLSMLETIKKLELNFQTKKQIQQTIF